MEKRIYTSLLFILFLIINCTASDLYWIGGSGDWNDNSHWSTTDGGPSAGMIPDNRTTAIFTPSSFNGRPATVTIQPGDWEVENITFNNISSSPILRFAGTAFNNKANLIIFGNLTLHPNLQLDQSDHTWIFDGDIDHRIFTAGKDIIQVEFRNENGTFYLQDDLDISGRLLLVAGTIESQNYDISCDVLIVSGSSGGTQFTKLMNMGTSEIDCNDFDARFNYGSFTMSGTPTIKVRTFDGGAGQTQSGFRPYYHNIILKNYEPSIQLADNNFKCFDCDIHKIIIEDTAVTRLNGDFVLLDDLEIQNLNSIIQLSGFTYSPDGLNLDIHGNIVTPVSGSCGDRVKIESISATKANIKKICNGCSSFTINDIILENIQAVPVSGLNYRVSNGVLLGNSTGWQQINVNPDVFTWTGRGSDDLWSNPDNWDSQNRQVGCIPSYEDDVVFDQNSFPSSGGTVTIPVSYQAACKKFTWDRNDPATLILQGPTNFFADRTSLIITGDILATNTLIIDARDRYRFNFSGNGQTTIDVDGVLFPDIFFKGMNAVWEFKSPLHAQDLHVEGGTFNTNGEDLVVENWLSIEEFTKVYNFGSSHITVNSEFALASNQINNVTVNPGTSFIETENLISIAPNLYDLQLNNPISYTLGALDLTLHKLILNGTQQVTTNSNGATLTTDILEFKSDNSALNISSSNQVTINKSISSQTSIANPGQLFSSTASTARVINFTDQNICVEGPVSFTDITTNGPGIFHAPEGIDGGNNTNINFDDGSANTSSLFWIGGDGNWELVSNWSKISGGCPASTDPSLVTTLKFDDNGLMADYDTIRVNGTQSANQMEWINTVRPAVLKINGSLSATELLMDNSELEIEENGISVSNKTELLNSSTLTIKSSNFRTTELSLSANDVLWIRDDARLEVIE